MTKTTTARALAIGLAAAGLAVGTAGVAQAAHGEGELTIGLSGGREVGSTGDRGGSGTIDLELYSASDAPGVEFPGEPYVCYDLSTRNVGEIVGLHIHEVADGARNPRRANGPVVVSLLRDGDRSVVNGDGETCVPIEDPSILDGILADPGDYYVNLHTTEFPAGAIRGQLHGF